MEDTKSQTLELKDHLWDKLCLQLWAQLQSQLDGYHRYQLRDQLEDPLWDSLRDELITTLGFQLSSEKLLLQTKGLLEEKREALGEES